MLNGDVKNGDGHIDSNRTDLNVKLENGTLLGTYKKLFGKSLEEYNAKQKREDRKIPNMREYLGSIEHNPRKTAEYEVIMQVGEKGDLDDLSLDQTNKLLTNVYNNFKESHPQFEIYSAVIHNDEATPHLHLKYVPYADGYTRGLSVQPSFRKACDQMDIKRDMRDYSETERNRIANEVKKELGYDRKLVGTHDYLEPEQFRKGIKEHDDEVAKLKEQAKNLKAGLNKMRSQASETAEQLKLVSGHLKYVKKQAFDKWGEYRDEISKRFDELNDNDKKMEWLQATSEYNDSLRLQNTMNNFIGKGGVLGTALATGMKFINKRKLEDTKKQIDDINAERDRIKTEIQMLQAQQRVEASINNLTKKSLKQTANEVGSKLRKQNDDAKAFAKGMKSLKQDLKDINDDYSKRFSVKSRIDQLNSLAEKVPDDSEHVSNDTKQLIADSYREKLHNNYKQAFEEKGISMSEEDVKAVEDNAIDEFSINLDGLEIPEEVDEEQPNIDLTNGVQSLSKEQNGMQR